MHGARRKSTSRPARSSQETQLRRCARQGERECVSRAPPPSHLHLSPFQVGWRFLFKGLGFFMGSFRRGAQEKAKILFFAPFLSLSQLPTQLLPTPLRQSPAPTRASSYLSTNSHKRLKAPFVPQAGQGSSRRASISSFRCCHQSSISSRVRRSFRQYQLKSRITSFRTACL